MVNLEKGGKVLLEKENNSGTPLSEIKIGLGWDQKESGASGADFDLDATVIALGDDGKSKQDWMCYFGNLKILNGIISHSGDNLTGEGDGDDEVISVKLNELPSEVEKLLIVVNIYEAEKRNQNFGMAENSYCRILNANDGDKELVHFDLNFDASTSTGVKFATLFRKNGEWAFSADQIEFAGGLKSICDELGIPA